MIQDREAEAKATAELGYEPTHDEFAALWKWGFIAGLISIPFGVFFFPEGQGVRATQFHSLVALGGGVAGYARVVFRDKRWYRRVAELSRGGAGA